MSVGGNFSPSGGFYVYTDDPIQAADMLHNLQHERGPSLRTFDDLVVVLPSVDSIPSQDRIQAPPDRKSVV